MIVSLVKDCREHNSRFIIANSLQSCDLLLVSGADEVSHHDSRIGPFGSLLPVMDFSFELHDTGARQTLTNKGDALVSPRPYARTSASTRPT